MIEKLQTLPAGESCSQARILGVGTALPPYALGQAQARELARGLFRDLPQVNRLIGVFENTGIAKRYLARPPSGTPTSTPSRRKTEPGSKPPWNSPLMPAARRF